jgi:hypothetical protein
MVIENPFSKPINKKNGHINFGLLINIVTKTVNYNVVF